MGKYHFPAAKGEVICPFAHRTPPMTEDPVIVFEHDPRWPALFTREKDQLERVLGPNVQIIHVGSTSVPGLCAKPIIDILIAESERRSVKDFSELLAPLDYVNVPHDGDDVRYFFRKDPRTVHIHIVELGSWTYWKHILLRDHLIHDQDDCMRYAELKRRSALLHRDDRQAYVDSKSELIEAMLIKGLAMFYCPYRRGGGKL